jgi:hypothetical protein
MLAEYSADGKLPVAKMSPVRNPRYELRISIMWPSVPTMRLSGTHTNKFQIVAYHMADNVLQRALPKMFVMALRTFSNRPSMSISTLFASTLECGDQTDYDSIMSVHRP